MSISVYVYICLHYLSGTALRGERVAQGSCMPPMLGLRRWPEEGAELDLLGGGWKGLVVAGGPSPRPVSTGERRGRGGKFRSLMSNTLS